MNKYSWLIILILVLVLIGGGVYIYTSSSTQGGGEVACTQEAKECPDGSYVGRTGPDCAFAACPSPSDYKDITYTIEGAPVTLVSGHAEAPSAPGSASQTVTDYFGNEAVGDLNGDGVDDVAFILTQSGGGSGTFYYVVVALKTKDGYEGTNAVLLGDRIAPQTTEIRGGQLIVNYADRKPTDPMTATPSVGKTKYLKVDGLTLKEI